MQKQIIKILKRKKTCIHQCTAACQVPNGKKVNVNRERFTELKKKKKKKEVAGPEIFGCFRGNISEEFHFDTTGGDGTDGYIEKYDWVFGIRWPNVPLNSPTADSSSRRHYRRNRFSFLVSRKQLWSGRFSRLESLYLSLPSSAVFTSFYSFLVR